jgi:hypothetical protein
VLFLHSRSGRNILRNMNVSLVFCKTYILCSSARLGKVGTIRSESMVRGVVPAFESRLNQESQKVSRDPKYRSPGVGKGGS